jgi:hypothetical protein
MGERKRKRMIRALLIDYIKSFGAVLAIGLCCGRSTERRVFDGALEAKVN